MLVSRVVHSKVGNWAWIAGASTDATVGVRSSRRVGLDEGFILVGSGLA
jgi:hypothetical protein